MDEEKKETDNLPTSVLPNMTHGDSKNLTEKARKNPWIISTFLLGAVMLVFIVGNLFGLTGFALTGKVVSGNTAGENLATYLEDNGYTAEVSSVKESNGLYLVDFSIDGKEDTIYMTKDGNYAISGLIPLLSEANADTGSNTQAQEVPKTDKPSVELYVFTYCPYGLQMEKAMMPAVKLFGDKINFKIRQIGAMHGEFEKVEAERQLCIEKNYPGKFLDYVLAFAEDTSCTSGSDNACVTTKVNSLFSKFGIDAAKINSCIASEGETLYNTEVSNSKSKSVSGSPTLIINGVDAQSGRSPEAVKTAICNAFSTAPSECSQTLSTNQAAAGFGSGTSSSSSTANCG